MLCCRYLLYATRPTPPHDLHPVYLALQGVGDKIDTLVVSDLPLDTIPQLQVVNPAYLLT